MPFILPANTLSAGGYDVANSLRFNVGSSDYLNRTLGAPTSDKIFTISAWVKRSTLGGEGYVFTIGSNGGSSPSHWYSIRYANEKIYVQRSGTGQLITNAVYRDTSAWYHIVLTNDTTQGTASNRLKLYVNGEQPSLGTATYPSENATLAGIDGARCAISLTYSGTGNYFGGYMSEVCFIDGQALAADSFGEFDEDSGIWKPISVSGLTFGNNGFYLETKQSGTSQNSSGLGADTSGNDNHFAVNNLTAVDQSTDTCTNNHATFNFLDNYAPAATFAEGNLQITTGGANIYSFNNSTIAVSSGKWYAEVKVITTAGNNFNMIGISALSPVYYRSSPWGELGGNAYAYAYVGYNGEYYTSGSYTSYGATYSTSIIGIYLDLDNNKLYFSKDGALQNSGTGISITAPASTPTGHYFFSAGNYIDNNAVYSANFGSAAFAITSANADDNGYGSFEYSPNITGDGTAKKFYALNTKNLAEFG